MTTVTLASPYINPNFPRPFFTMEDSSSRAEADTLRSYANTNSSTFKISLGREKAKDGELDIFDAEKYFSGGMDGDKTPFPERCWKEPAAKKELRASRWMKLATSSNCSETSGNSRSLLLRDIRRDSSLSSQNPANRSMFPSFMRCKCSCSGKNSVAVDDKTGDQNLVTSAATESKQIQAQVWNKTVTGGQERDGLGAGGLKREVYSTFPTMNPRLGTLTVESGKTRISSEVLRPPALLAKESLGSSSARSLTRPTMTAGGGLCSERDDDLRSESSSDLFELESLSTSLHPFFQEDESGEGVLAPTRFYEPSEASIEWSVVTASAANFSVASELSELRVSGPTSEMKKTARHHQRSRLFTGCVSGKAVRVVANKTQKMPEKTRSDQYVRRPGSGAMPAMKYHGESCKVVDFELARAGRALATRCDPTKVPPHHR